MAIGRGGYTIALGWVLLVRNIVCIIVGSIEGSSYNGASDYGNKYGEPVIGGFTRDFANTDRVG